MLFGAINEDDDRAESLEADKRQLESNSLWSANDDDSSDVKQSLSLSMMQSESTGSSRSRASMGASPLLRDVHAAQAELDVVFRTPGDRKSAIATGIAHRTALDDVDGNELMERISQL